MDTEYATKVAELNDTFRRNGYGVTVTQGVRALGDTDWLLYTVQRYDRFDENNDPYHEHDFGSLEWYGAKVFWKLDYFDQALRYWCDPLSDDCRRVLTVVLAEEY